MTGCSPPQRLSLQAVHQAEGGYTLYVGKGLKISKPEGLTTVQDVRSGS
jgi:hypothetical protein